MRGELLVVLAFFTHLYCVLWHFNLNLHVVLQSKSAVPPEQGLSNGLIILVIAIVVGCFAVLWPK